MLRRFGLPASAHGAVTSASRLTLSGVACVGSAYGMARYGFGLLLPDMRAALRLSDVATGAMAAAGYAVYLLVSLRTGTLVARHGPRATVVAGGGCAVAGMLLAAVAPSPLALGVAVAVAGASAALVFPPFADAIAAVVAETDRAQAFAWVSSGTGAGVAVAAPLAFLAADWRLTWVLFALVAALTTLLAARVVPAAPLARERAHGERARPRRAESLPLLASAVLVGLGAAVFWTWAVERVATDGDLGTGAAQVLLAIVGVASLGGALASGLVARVGLRAGGVGCGALLAASLVALALIPGAVVAGIAAAVFFGAGYNLLVAIQGLWSLRISGYDPAQGLAAVMSAMGVGFLLGPLLAAPLEQRTAFLAAAAFLAAGGSLSLTAPRAARTARQSAEPRPTPAQGLSVSRVRSVSWRSRFASAPLETAWGSHTPSTAAGRRSCGRRPG
jgi:predicted MFS family arabinose efflux permease